MRKGDTFEICTHFQVLLQAVKVKPDCLLVKVSVRANLQPRVLEQRNMVAPGRSGEINDFSARVMPRQEGATNPKGTGSGDGLGDCNLSYIGVSAIQGQTRPSRTDRILV